jgi:hypothetical protein
MSSTSRDIVASLDAVGGGGGGGDLGAAAVAVARNLEDMGCLEQLYQSCSKCFNAEGSERPYPVTKFGRVAARSREEQRL